MVSLIFSSRREGENTAKGYGRRVSLFSLFFFSLFPGWMELSQGFSQGEGAGAEAVMGQALLDSPKGRQLLCSK